MNLVEALFQRVRELGRWSTTAILYEERAITYEQLFVDVKRCGAMLEALGINRGDRVAVLAHDCPEFVIAFLGAAAVGAVAVPLSTMLSAEEVLYVLDHCEAQAVVVTSEQREKLEASRSRLPELRIVLEVGGQGSEGALDFHEALAGAREGEIRDADDNQLALILYTSGSTGRPKGAMHTHANLPFTLRTCCREALKVEPEDRLYSSSKLFFAYGLGNSLTFALGSAATSVLSKERPIPPVVAEVLRRYRPTVFFGVPAVYRALLASMRDGNAIETASIRFCVSAGEKLPAGIFHEWKEATGLDILDGIGSTEMLQMFITNTLDWIKPGSSGRTVPGYEARLVDQSGEEISGPGTGNLLIRGGSATSGYWRDAEKSTALMTGEWMRTGDVYRRDEDDFYWFEGRSDDLFKVKGLWISPAEIEDALVACGDVLEAAVVSCQTEDGTTSVAAHVVLKDRTMTAGKDAVDKLRSHVRSLLPSYKCPSEIHFTDQLPRTATGKLQRYKLRNARMKAEG